MPAQNGSTADCRMAAPPSSTCGSNATTALLLASRAVVNPGSQPVLLSSRIRTALGRIRQLVSVSTAPPGAAQIAQLLLLSWEHDMRFH
jgi:hypothetical protein